MTIDRDQLDAWMRERNLMLMRQSYFEDLTRELAAARRTATRLHGIRLDALDYLDDCANGLGSVDGDVVREKLSYPADRPT